MLMMTKDFFTAIRAAKNVTDLLNAINSLSAEDYRDVNMFATRNSLPSFGGEHIYGESVYSYDDRDVLVRNARGAGNFRVVSRAAMPDWLIKSGLRS